MFQVMPHETKIAENNFYHFNKSHENILHVFNYLFFVENKLFKDFEDKYIFVLT